jgi:hypothetical protein
MFMMLKHKYIDVQMGFHVIPSSKTNIFLYL